MRVDEDVRPRPAEQQPPQLAASPAAAVGAAVALVGPLLPAERHRALTDAGARVARGHARVLILGQAKRGKSTLVNSLFAAPLLPTGALPLTSVATVVTVGREPRAEVRHHDGRTASIGLDGVAALVSEQGNPGNERGVDRVCVTAPTPWLPPGTEVVDTPGTGSVYEANTDEANRAMRTLDVGVLVVSADPPVSAAELDLLAEVATTASRVVVVVNKADLVESEVVAEVVDFTGHVVERRLGAPVPVFALSALPGRSGSAGFAVFAAWLRDEISTHGTAHALASTRRAVRREATVLRDSFLVEEELLQRSGKGAADTVDALSDIVARADDRARAAVDHLRGDAQRLGRSLDTSHAAVVAQALTSAERLILQSADGVGSPEERADVARSTAAAATRRDAERWHRTAATELDRETRRSVERALAGMTADLAEARRAAGALLNVELSALPELPSAAGLQTPSFEASMSPVWEELISTAVKRRLPAALRRRMLRRELENWRQSAVPRPFGRACSELRSALRESLRVAERSMEATRRDYFDALHRGLTAVRDDDRSRSDIGLMLGRLELKFRAVNEALALLNPEQDDDMQIAGV
jgi:small GTP-binding protein